MNRQWSSCCAELIPTTEPVFNKQSTTQCGEGRISILNIGC
jgi:hypothetical protein